MINKKSRKFIAWVMTIIVLAISIFHPLQESIIYMYFGITALWIGGVSTEKILLQKYKGDEL